MVWNLYCKPGVLYSRLKKYCVIFLYLCGITRQCENGYRFEIVLLQHVKNIYNIEILTCTLFLGTPLFLTRDIISHRCKFIFDKQS